MRHLLQVNRRLALLLMLCTVMIAVSGCLIKPSPYSYGKMKVRIYNDGDDMVTNVRVAHGDAFDMFTEVAPGNRRSTSFPLVADTPFTVEYSHPTTGVVTRVYNFHARREDAGIVDLRINRLGVIEARTRAKLKK